MKTKTIKEALYLNPYVGRGIILGTASENVSAAAYFIMGRSENSRNRLFSVKDGKVFTEPYDVSKVKDPSLIIYNAVNSFENNLIVTNGDQTDTVWEYLKAGKTFEQALETRTFEPEAPNFTPRISGLVNFSNGKFSCKLSILKSVISGSEECQRFFFEYPSVKGLGHFVHTYVTDGNPLPSFEGEPERVEIPNDIDEFANEIWKYLDEQNKISLYVRYTDAKSGEYQERVINKYNR